MPAISPDAIKLDIHRGKNGWIVSYRQEDVFGETFFVAETPNALAGLLFRWATDQEQRDAPTAKVPHDKRSFAVPFVTDAVPLSNRGKQAKTYLDRPELKVPDYQPNDAPLPLQDNARDVYKAAVDPSKD